MHQAEYYQNKNVIYKMLPFVQNREVAFLQKLGEGYSFRNIKITTAVNFYDLLNHFEMHKYPYKIYNSTAILKDMPIFSYNIPERKAQSKIFHESFMNYVNNYEFVLDIDNKGDFAQCYEETKRIISALDEEQIAYYIKFSGSGFNIIIPHQNIGYAKKTELQDRFQKIANAIQEICDVTLLDTTIYMMREVTKTLYSLDTENNTVCMPLSRQEFYAFNHEMVQLERMFEESIMDRRVIINNKETMGCLEKLETYCEITNMELEDDEGESISL